MAVAYADFTEGKHDYHRLNVGDILTHEARVAKAVADNEFATVDLRKVRSVLASEPFTLDESFLAGYKDKEPAWGELGWFTFKRTYARRVEREDGTSIRTEEWSETVRRVVEGNLNMIQNDPLVTQEYGQKMYHTIWNLVWTPPGRGLWMSGSEFSKRSGDAFNNCWFIETRPWHYGETNKIFTRYTIDPQKQYVSFPFVFLFDNSMKGGGVGFSAEQRVIDLIPTVRNQVDVYFFLREDHPDYAEIKKASEELGYPLNQVPGASEVQVQLTVADTREGWAEAYAVVIDEHFREDEKHVAVYIDLSEIRERGTPIKGFGGVASGSEPLARLLHFATKRINQFIGRKLDSVAVTDLHNMTGKAVVAGNVRRTAEVGLASPKDDAFIHMKNYRLVEHVTSYDEDWNAHTKTVEELVAEGYDRTQAEEDVYTAWAQDNHRWASNNSVVIDDPRNYDFGFISAGIEANGEPGVFNRFLAQNFGRIIDGYREMCDKATGGNPCMEISLESGEPCNLAETMLPVMYKLGIDASEVLPMMVHYTKRVTFSKYDWELSAEVIWKNRRIGISLSGFTDWVLMRFGSDAIIGWNVYDKSDWHDMAWLDMDVGYKFTVTTGQPDYDPETEVIEPVYNDALVAELDRMYKIVIQADIEYSALLTQALGYLVEPSVKDTTVKPSGTVSLMPGISPGVHAHYFRYGIRRIQLQQNDPLKGLAELAGYKSEPYSKNPENTAVIEFPFKAPTADHPDFKDASEVTIEYQFAMQALLNIYWADNMVSCTVTFQEHEKPKIKGLLEQYRMRIKSTSLLPYSGHGYVQAPYEPKDKAWYEETMKGINFKPQELYRILMETGDFQDHEMTLSEALECAGGHCPVR